MSESWSGLITDSIGHLPSFSMPTHACDLGNHSNGYGHLKTAGVQSFTDCRKTASSMALKLGFDFRNDKNYGFLFKIVNLLIRLGSLMICTHDLTVLTKTKETIRYCESFRYGGRNTLTNISNDLTHLSVPAEDE
jgi:hypothetical protein